MACCLTEREMIMPEPMLQLRGVGKSFGGLRVCDNINLELIPGELHALIGPNGAGKTTLLNLISGLLQVDTGTLHFQGTNFTSRPIHARSQLGMARSFQVTSILQGFTVQQNIALAVQSTQGSSFRFWKRAADDPLLQDPAGKVMAQVGLADRGSTPASSLSHGEQRQLEMGMALATEPDLLLLDEPMAGLGPGGSRNLAELIDSLKSSVTILLVEHDMQTVFSLADRITVLVQGEIIATGAPQQIRNNPAVQEAYLGG